MGEATAIGWTDHTFNGWWGCEKVSAACDNCYAATFAHRLGKELWGKDAPRRFFGDGHWREPLRWDAKAAEAGERRRVFASSMADVFEDRRDLDEHRARLFDLIVATPHLDWLLLTKRPQHIRRLVPSGWYEYGYPRNVWLGTTVEDDRYARIRLPKLLAAGDAAVFFVSYEPALGPVDFSPWLEHLDWIIAGGESGAGHRPPDVEWFRRVRDDCASEGVAFFLKQWGGRTPTAGGRSLDGVTHDAFPEPRQCAAT